MDYRPRGTDCGVPTATATGSSRVQVDFEQLNTTVTSLSVFDALKSEGDTRHSAVVACSEVYTAVLDLPGGAIIRDNGRISGCFEEWEAGLCLQDRCHCPLPSCSLLTDSLLVLRLRVALAKPDSEDYEALPETLRQELIVTLFRYSTLILFDG